MMFTFSPSALHLSLNKTYKIKRWNTRFLKKRVLTALTECDCTTEYAYRD
jgi:hypothetical protein